MSCESMVTVDLPQENRGGLMLVEDFGKFAADMRYEDLPAQVVEAGKLRVLDLLGAGLAGYQMGCHRQLMPLLGGAPEASVWGQGLKVSLRDAALANSFLSHALYLDDGSRFTGGHPSSVVIPSAVALAEQRRATGKDLITAVVVGYEVFLRMGRAIYPSTVVRGFQSTAVLGGVASAAGCGSLLKFSPAMATNGLAIACNLGVGLKEALRSSASQPVQVARSCEGGLMAALFAGQGAEGAPGIIEAGFLKAFSEQPQYPGMMDELGHRFSISETYIKVHGGCRGNHAPVDVTNEVIFANFIGREEIAALKVCVDSVTYAAEVHSPVSGDQAQFSVAFAIAVALVHGDASVFQYTDAKVSDPDVRAMMSKVQVDVDKRFDKHYPDQRAASVEITLVDGRSFRGHIDNAKGEPESPLSTLEIEKKFLTLTQGVLAGKGDQVRDMVLGLDDLEDVSQLTALLNTTSDALCRARAC